MSAMALLSGMLNSEGLVLFQVINIITDVLRLSDKQSHTA